MPSPAAAPSPKPSRTIAADFPVGFFLRSRPSAMTIRCSLRLRTARSCTTSRRRARTARSSLHSCTSLTRWSGASRSSNPMCLWFSPATSTRRTTITCTDLTWQTWSPGQPVKLEESSPFRRRSWASTAASPSRPPSCSPPTRSAGRSGGSTFLRTAQLRRSSGSRTRAWRICPTRSRRRPSPEINGLRYSPRTNHIYYTTTGQKLFMRVEIDPIGFEPAGSPERLCGGGMYDDFCIDEPRGVAYQPFHRENRIDCAPLAPGGPGLACAGRRSIGYDAARALQRRLEPRAGRADPGSLRHVQRRPAPLRLPGAR